MTSNWNPKVTRREFIDAYCERSGLTREQLEEMNLYALPCACDFEGCDGWAIVRVNTIEDHFSYYGPDLIKEEFNEAQSDEIKSKPLYTATGERIN